MLFRSLVIPTFLGITVMVFAITRFVPGGPIEQAIQRTMLAANESEGGRGSGGSSNNIDSQPLGEAQLKQLKEYYGFDKPILEAYFVWLGRMLRGDLGRSTKYNDPVLKMIVSRIPISLRFGITSVLLTYLISIPLGVKKALKHRKGFDNVSSIAVFIGYALPGYIVAIILLSVFAVRLDWLPIGGLQSANHAGMNPIMKLWDSVKHMILPMIAYIMGNFAVMTMVMKNNLMENMAADYIKTAVAKGRTFKDAMWKHAFRNSIIPIAAGLGGLITIFFSGSFLIENIFNIRGMGMLGYTSIVERDYPVVLGVTAITAFLSLVGNILSDLILSLVDPRIRLGK